MIKLPPVIFSNPATDQAVQDLLGASRPLGVFIIELPDSPERERAAVMLNEAILWAHQALLRATGGRTQLVMPAGELQQ